MKNKNQLVCVMFEQDFIKYRVIQDKHSKKFGVQYLSGVWRFIFQNKEDVCHENTNYNFDSVTQAVNAVKKLREKRK